MERKLTLRTGDAATGRLVLNPQDAQTMDLELGDIVEFIDEEVDEAGAARVQLSEDVEAGTFLIASNLADSISATEGYEYLVRKYDQELNKRLERVVIGVAPDGEMPNVDVESLITDGLNEVERFLMHRLIFNGLKIHWKERGVILEISETIPRLAEKEYVVFQELKLELYPVMKTAFNGILLIDMSKSMQAKDMVIDPKVRLAFQQLHDMAYGRIQDVEDFLCEVEKGQTARRIDSALISAMLFFSEKIARGKGEKIAVVPYSDDAVPLMFDTEARRMKWLDVSQSGYADMKSDVAMVLGSSLLSILKSSDARHTNMGKALSVAHEIADEMAGHEVGEKGYPAPLPVMIILLTDGEFDVGPSPVRFAKSYLSVRSRTVVHTVGIGSDIDESVLKRISELGRGEFTKADDLGRLMEFYSSLAGKFKTVVCVGKGDEAPAAPHPSAPKAPQPPRAQAAPRAAARTELPAGVLAQVEEWTGLGFVLDRFMPNLSDPSQFDNLRRRVEKLMAIRQDIAALDREAFSEELDRLAPLLADPSRSDEASMRSGELMRSAANYSALGDEIESVRRRYFGN